MDRWQMLQRSGWAAFRFFRVAEWTVWQLSQETSETTCLPWAHKERSLESPWQERHFADLDLASAIFLLKIKIPTPRSPLFSTCAAPGPWQDSQASLLAGLLGMDFFEW